jgi:type II secretory pathway component GspD/PulD (secretin)
VIMNAESGVITVRATQRQHDRIQEFLDRVVNSARRQVLIEATIVEVTLNDGYQQGINWSQLASGGTLNFIGDSLTKNAINLSYTKNGHPDALVTMLNTFGTTKVLSSPRLSVMNNQTALLKVVENYVYFSVKADTTTTANVGTTTAYTTTPQSVSVGLVVSVTPQISDSDASHPERPPDHHQRRPRGAGPESRTSGRTTSAISYQSSGPAKSSRSCASPAATSPSLAD